MPILNEDQKRFLIACDVTDQVHGTCDHETCHDKFHTTAIEVATALETYQVTGEQFASIIMDMVNQVGQLAGRRPDLAGPSGLSQFIRQATALAALAYRQYRDSNPDEEAGPDA